MYCTRCGTVNPDAAHFCSNCGATFASSGSAAPSAAPAYAAAAAPAQPGPFHYAGFWRRFVAMIIDGLVFTPLVILCLATTGVFGVILQPEADRNIEGPLAALIGLGIFAWILVITVGNWLYHTWMESSRYQATLGKMALGIVVTDMYGNRISFARANGRFFGKIVSGMIMNIGYLMAAFTEKKQALHDMLASCLVVMKK
ncbi:MAG TPA: RDD family protein [Bryobacteraceae bacterium]|nr:RDD family protein [Bryobacteraceae bacterium]